jgi:hypothetical protein
MGAPCAALRAPELMKFKRACTDRQLASARTPEEAVAWIEDGLVDASMTLQLAHALLEHVANGAPHAVLSVACMGLLAVSPKVSNQYITILLMPHVKRPPADNGALRCCADVLITGLRWCSARPGSHFARWRRRAGAGAALELPAAAGAACAGSCEHHSTHSTPATCS